MTLARYHNPWSILGSLRHELQQLNNFPEESYESGDWVPAVDVREEKERFCISADLPGVKPEDVEITIEGGYMTLRGSRDEQKVSDAEGYRRTERIQGSFYRRFSLPKGADADNVKAESRDGVLQITVPKHEKELPRRIKVSH